MHVSGNRENHWTRNFLRNGEFHGVSANVATLFSNAIESQQQCIPSDKAEEIV